MECYYLIDFENVGGDGLAGSEKLSCSDHILIFFTDNNRKLDMGDLAQHGTASLDMIQVPAGKQSADLHIASYLGYLAGTQRGKAQEVVIVSKDTDFDHVIRFWNKRSEIQASRRETIRSAAKSVKLQSNPVSQPKQGNKTAFNSAVMRALSDAGYNSQTVGKVTSLAVSHYGKGDMSSSLQRELKGVVSNPRVAYQAIQSVLPKAEKAKEVPELTKALRRAGLNQQQAAEAAMLAAKHTGEVHYKQVVYRFLTERYGQQRGLAIYSQIKSVL